ncbi:BirA family biotin operon repressor/biotin-[acetyl-CoA-carboxylase] ligase [Evansella vedderi]|uniref:Bifunctional ligase/repressor BirA n=1 Tax=Evansella vedderi TaxID=38282 RepID=A0ABU0A1S9_9BACI|nr:biotin--[acetyl-CoA-carboxylase] ligase [Evansella vedderi]MDQ0257446.1 BirA family biotin operon repressor/biotin-[acetyl-CoA-carboxylase] ligase [Evansella vedderi]
MKGKVLQLLRDHRDDFLSGERISEELSCSRTMVWKYIDSLRKEGYEILAVSNKGYQLKGESDVVSVHAIESRLIRDSMFQHINYEESAVSTQISAHKLDAEGALAGTVVVANEQTGGRGRLGRSWYSPPDTGIWMSMILRPEVELREAPQITLVTAIAVVRGIEKATDIEVDIKWPNDLLLCGKKIAGILTEMQADPDRVNSVIVGIGINVNQTSFPEDVKGVATSLSAMTGKIYHRAAIIAEILNEFQWLYDTYLTKGFSFLKPLWEARAVTIGKKIIARTPKESIEGIAEGIDEEGVLLLRDNNNKLHRIYSADIDLSKN